MHLLLVPLRLGAAFENHDHTCAGRSLSPARERQAVKARRLARSICRLVRLLRFEASYVAIAYHLTLGDGIGVHQHRDVWLSQREPMAPATVAHARHGILQLDRVVRVVRLVDSVAPPFVIAIKHVKLGEILLAHPNAVRMLCSAKTTSQAPKLSTAPSERWTLTERMRTHLKRSFS